jgi:hypothetical protein
VSIVDGNGNTNSVDGLTGRNGEYWVEGVPLGFGTNALAITLRSQAGETTTNLTLVQGGSVLTVNPAVGGETNVTGTIGEEVYTIWANGVQAVQSNGTWVAAITPVGYAGGMVEVTAIPNTDNGGNGSGGGGTANPWSSQSINAQATVQPAQGVFVASYHRNEQTQSRVWRYDQNMNQVWYTQSTYDIMNWVDGEGGRGVNFIYECGNPDWGVLYETNWPASEWPQAPLAGRALATHWYNDYERTNTPTVYTNAAAAPSFAMEHCDVNEFTDANGSRLRRVRDTEVRLATGGPLGSTEKNFWLISASATAYTNESDTVGVPVPPELIQVGTFGHLDTNGELMVVLPDNDPDDATLLISLTNRITGVVTIIKNPFLSQCVATTPTNRNRTVIGVGEEVTLSFSAPLRQRPLIQFTNGGSMVGYVPPFVGSNYWVYTAPSNAATVTITATFVHGGASYTKTFEVVEPTGCQPDMTYVLETDNVGFPPGVCGMGAHFLVTFAPTNVSFYRVQVMEVGQGATNVSGIFSTFNTNVTSHVGHGADVWVPVTGSNAWSPTAPSPLGRDYVTIPVLDPWSSGAFGFDIPVAWQVGNQGPTNSMPGWFQSMCIDTNGTSIVRKFGYRIQRTLSGEYSIEKDL